MSNSVFWTQVNRAFAVDGTPVSGAKAYFYENNTTTQTPIFSDALFTTEFEQPLVADADGVFDTVYAPGSSALTVLMTDSASVTLPGYPVNDIVPFTDAGTAASISFSPTEDVPETNVQAAIEAAAALTSDFSDVVERSLTPWVTGGSSNAYTIAPDPAFTAYYAGMTILVRPDRANSGAATINVNDLGVRNLQYMSRAGSATALVAGDIQPYTDILITYDGTRFVASLGRMATSVSAAGGNYTRWLDGTQIATLIVEAQGPVSTAAGNIFKSSNISPGTWPVAFIAAPVWTASVYSAGTNQNVWVARRSRGSASTCGQVAIMSDVTSADTDFVLEFTGVGRWYA